jgi:hypothetical protein
MAYRYAASPPPVKHPVARTHECCIAEGAAMMEDD